MLTHISRGMESIPAVLLTGSIVRTIIVSVQSGQPWLLSPPRSPRISTFTRLAPSHAGGSAIWGALSVGLAVGTTAVAPGMVATAESRLALVEQFGGGVPGSGVTCQQATNPLSKNQSSAASITPNPRRINWKMEGGVKARLFCL